MDRDLYRWINRLADRTTWAHGMVSFYAHYGTVLFAALLLSAYLHGRRHDDRTTVAASLWAGGAALVALGIGQIIGQAVNRARPYAAMSDVHTLVARSSDFSFPSDHATVAGAVAIGLLLTHRRIGISATIAAVAMAITRVYVGAHYPFDVIAGLALGGTVAAIGRRLIVPILAKVLDRLASTSLRAFITATRTTSA